MSGHIRSSGSGRNGCHGGIAAASPSAIDVGLSISAMPRSRLMVRGGAIRREGPQADMLSAIVATFDRRTGPASTRLGLLGFPPAIFTNHWVQDSHLCASQRSARLSSGLHAGPWASRVQLLFRHRNTQVLCAMHSPSSVSRTTDGGSART
jgi:hypothetical protein